MLIGFAISHVIHQWWTGARDWSGAFGLWFWQASAVMTYVFLLWLD
jgi:hypothetical protein